MEKLPLNLKDFEFEYTQRDRQPPLLADLWLVSFSTVFMDELGIPLPPQPYILTSKSSGYSHKEWKKKVLAYIDEHDLYESIISKADRRADEFLKKAKEISKLEPEEAWKEFITINSKVVPFFYGPWYITEYNLLTNKIAVLLKPFQKEIEKITDLNTALQNLIVSEKPLALQEEKDFFNKLLEKPTDGLLDEYIERFGWMKCFMILPGNILSKQELIERLRNAKPSHTDGSHKEAEKKLRTKLLKIITDERIKRYISLAQEIGWLLTDSVDRFMKAYALLQPTYKKIAARVGLSHEDMLFLTVSELSARLKDTQKVSPELIHTRKEGYIIYSTGKERGMIEGKDAAELASVIDTATRGVPNDISQITGTGIYKGIIKGKARICKTPADSHKVLDGEIMVAGMTSPDYLLAMKRSIGFVTDEGGLLCHAAIISRELRKVCVVGTKIGTKFLKDGDVIEVDAEKGIVRKLS